MGIGGVGIGVFVGPMTDDLGWSRAAMGGAFTIRAIVMATVGPVMGPLVDRRMGAPLLFAGGGFIAGGSIILLSMATEIWHYYLLFGIGWSVGQLAFGGNVLTGPIVAKWFIRKRGRAMGIYTMGIPIGSIIFVPLNAVLVTTLGWQSAWVLLGLATWALTIPMALFTMRRQPEDMGLYPDGVRDAAEAQAALEPSARHAQAAREGTYRMDWTLTQALRTPTLYLLMFSFLFMGLAMGIFTIHQVPAITDKGFDLAVASIVSVTLSVCSFIVKPTVGFLSERFSPRFLCALCMSVGASWGGDAGAGRNHGVPVRVRGVLRLRRGGDAGVPERHLGRLLRAALPGLDPRDDRAGGGPGRRHQPLLRGVDVRQDGQLRLRAGGDGSGRIPRGGADADCEAADLPGPAPAAETASDSSAAAESSG